MLIHLNFHASQNDDKYFEYTLLEDFYANFMERATNAVRFWSRVIPKDLFHWNDLEFVDLMSTSLSAYFV